MFTTVAFLESVSQAGLFNPTAAIPDQHVTVVGDDIRVPTLNQIIAVAVGVETVAAHRARLVSPSLRRVTNLELNPINGIAAGPVEPATPQAVVDLRRSPIPLVVGENLNAELLATPAVAQIQWVIVWLADGTPAVVEGRQYSVRATGATALVGSVWSNVALTFAEDLPRGRYQVVGFRPESAGLVAARLVFPGAGAAGWRPGALGVDAQGDLQDPMFRHGGLGVWGEFEDIEPPTVDFLSVSADAAQVVTFDLLQVREGPG